jgi:hypothetical protein
METTVKVTEFAKKLRTRLAKLKAERTRAIKKYEEDFDTWKTALSAWCIQNYRQRVDRITKTEVKANSSSYRRETHFSTERFFDGAPKPPAFPDDKQIREIQSTLRHLGITGQTTIRISTDCVKKWFGEEDDD